MSEIEYMKECMARDLVVMLVDEQKMSLHGALDALYQSETYAKQKNIQKTFCGKRKINLSQTKNRSPEIEKSFGADFSASLYTLTHSRLRIDKNINSFYFGSNRHFLLCPIPIP